MHVNGRLDKPTTDNTKRNSDLQNRSFRPFLEFKNPEKFKQCQIAKFIWFGKMKNSVIKTSSSLVNHD